VTYSIEKDAGLFAAGAAGLKAAVPRAAAGVTSFLEKKVAPMFASGLKPVANVVAPPAGPAATSLYKRVVNSPGALRRGDLMNRAKGSAPRNNLMSATATAAKVPPPITPAKNTFGHLAWQGIRGGAGFGPSENATRTGSGIAHAAGIGAIAAPLAVGAFSRGGDANNPYQQQLGMEVRASYKAAGVYTVKTALDPSHVRAGVDLASYGALAAPLIAKLIAPKFYDQHQGLMHGADVAGLAGLASTGLYGVATGHGRERAYDGMDVAGLGLMGLALHRRLTEH